MNIYTSLIDQLALIFNELEHLDCEEVSEDIKSAIKKLEVIKENHCGCGSEIDPNSDIINYRTMNIYAIQFSNGVETSSDLNVIERKAKKYAEQKKTATITENGNEIGWIGEDLTKRKGWGWYIKK